ncbi:proline-rich protein PRCC [Ostrinia nubilalis]|uniref:proline-rich protein PRCC n=1 Tax=Ostrinia nubilalis TaxID=29057 RepID=UPI0030826433
MALVAYDYSDSSDAENEDENPTTVAVLPTKIEEAQTIHKPDLQSTKPEAENVKSETPSNLASAESNNSYSQSLFNLLPQPSTKKPSVEEDDDEFLHKKESSSSMVKPKAKITVPSLSDFKDVEPSIPSNKPKISNGKKSGLLSILPQPRNAVSSSTTKSFVPHVLTQKPTATAKKKPLPSPMKKAKSQVNTLAQDYSDDSDDEEMQNDFFSINRVDDTPIEDIPLDIDTKATEVIVKNTKTEKEPRGLQSYFKQDIPENPAESLHEQEGSDAQYDYPNSSTSGYENEYVNGASTSNEAVLDDEAILKLCGTRGKRKREEIQIVDVNQKEVLADAREWLLKGLMDDTTKRVSASKRRGDEPTSQQRRKHQITYLAHQAKANEAELQNQWANNRMTKRQTQSKYGF